MLLFTFKPIVCEPAGYTPRHAVSDDFGSISMESAAEMIGSILVMAILINFFKNLYTYLFQAALGTVKYWFCSQPIIGYLLGGWCSP